MEVILLIGFVVVVAVGTKLYKKRLRSMDKTTTDSN